MGRRNNAAKRKKMQVKRRKQTERKRLRVADAIYTFDNFDETTPASDVSAGAEGADEYFEIDYIKDGITSFIDHMQRVLAATSSGGGLAAPQIGHLLRIFVTQNKGESRYFINPEIVKTSDDMENGTEGCLSYPGVIASVERYQSVDLVWQDINGVEHSETFEGFFARLVQHEMDHLADPPVCKVGDQWRHERFHKEMGRNRSGYQFRSNNNNNRR